MDRIVDLSNLSVAQAAKVIEEMFMADLLECFKEIFYDIAVQSMQIAVHKDVYAKYRSTGSPYRRYKRRKEEGGLSDPRNFDIQIYREKNGNIIGYVKNITRGVGKAYELDAAIVYGDQYDWLASKIYRLQPFPRDFYQGTIDRIEDSNWVYKVRRLMNQRGWKTTGK